MRHAAGTGVPGKASVRDTTVVGTCPPLQIPPWSRKVDACRAPRRVASDRTSRDRCPTVAATAPLGSPSRRIRHEAYLPTQQPPQEAQARVSPSCENPTRTSSPEATPQEGTSSVGRVSRPVPMPCSTMTTKSPLGSRRFRAVGGHPRACCGSDAQRAMARQVGNGPNGTTLVRWFEDPGPIAPVGGSLCTVA